MPAVPEPEAFHASPGELASSADLVLRRAQRLAHFVEGRDDVGARLIEARKRDEEEWLILGVAVDVGQAPAVDIQHEERIAVGFTSADRDWPYVMALRSDFPEDVSHQFVRVEGAPVALCLSEEAWQEARLRWSPGAFLRLLRTWLIDTARGALHRGEQPVEPFIVGSAARAILPADLFAPTRQGAQLYGRLVGRRDEGPPIYAFDFEGEPNAIAAAAGVLFAPPQVHGVVRGAPRTLAEMILLFGSGDAAFSEQLDAVVADWLKQNTLHPALPVLIIQVPMLREEGAEPERKDLVAFLLNTTVRDLGLALDLWSLEGDGGPILFGRKPGPYGEGVEAEAVNILLELAPEVAAQYNGLEGPSCCSIAAIGAGALGSQVISNLTRMGESVSVIVDQDRLFPHNLARHAVWDRELLGWSKARALALMVRRMRSGASEPTAFMADITDSKTEHAGQLLDALRSSDVILDMAASVAVSRSLAVDVESDGRRISAFLSPNGLDLVVLAEDRARETRLDHLEMALYGAVVSDPELEGHFALVDGRRYARGCRDVSAKLPQTAVALHAAVAAQQVRDLIESDAAAAGVWRLDHEAMTLRRIALDTRPMRSFDAPGWTVLVSESLLEQLALQRNERLPAETGGVLLGAFDADRQLIYVVAHIPSPVDSIEQADGYVRGAFGTAEAVQAAAAATLGMLRYVGEWHSHPDGVPVIPSADDMALFSHLVEGMEVEGHPPVMLIVGQEALGVVTLGEVAGE